MMEYFCIGFVMGVLLALIQPSLWAIAKKWRKRQPVTQMPVMDTAPQMSTLHERTPWTFQQEPFGFPYTLPSNGPLGLVAKIEYKTSSPIGYYNAYIIRSHGLLDDILVQCENMTFEQACAWIKHYTLADGPNPVHLSKK